MFLTICDWWLTENDWCHSPLRMCACVWARQEEGQNFILVGCGNKWREVRKYKFRMLNLWCCEESVIIVAVQLFLCQMYWTKIKLTSKVISRKMFKYMFSMQIMSLVCQARHYWTCLYVVNFKNIAHYLKNLCNLLMLLSVCECIH